MERLRERQFFQLRNWEALGTMHDLLLLKLIILLAIANGAPVVATKMCGTRFSRPVDGGLRLSDGHPIFGPSKTIRGAVISIATTTGAAFLIGLDLKLGALVGSMAMVGDLFSSFVKRRLNFLASSRATGLDHIPEALFPLLTARCYVPLTSLDILIGVGVFSIGAVALSPIFYRVGLRNRPF
jgi:hypothetical protein